VGAQAQDRYAARLTFRSRSRRLTAADVDRARTEERSLLRTWLMRKTVHMIATEDAWWMLPLFEPAVEKWSRRRLGQLGLTAGQTSKALRVIGRALEREGPLSRTEARKRVQQAGIPLDNHTGLHIVGLATVSGLAIQGPDIGAGPSLVLREEWLPRQKGFDRDAALAELARRYLAAFGPATAADLARWAGLPLRDARAGLSAIAGELADESASLLSLKGRRTRLPRAGQVRLLGAFDTYLLGYESRDFAVPAEAGRAINTRGGGMIEPVIVRDGELLGTWRLKRGKQGIEVALAPFAKLDQATRRAVGREVRDISRFEGVPGKLA
jgi:hypothetical protein